MKPIAKTSALVGALFLAASSTFSGQLQRTDVINDPVWVLHVDADALRQTTFGQLLLTEMEKPEAQKKFAAFQAIFSFDPRKELHGLTLYSATKAEEDGVLLVYADVDPARLTTLAEGAKDHQSGTHGKYTIHNWIDEKKKGKDGGRLRTYAAIHGKTVIFAQKESRVAHALDVLDRAKPNLSANPEFAKLGTSPAFIQAAARKLESRGDDPAAAVLKQSKMLTLNVGESSRKLQATLAAETESDEVAKQIESIGRGLVGLMALQKEKPEALKLASGLGIRQEGVSVVATLSLPVEEVIEMAKSAETRKQAAKQ
jgi:hypothetical protein